MARIETDPNYSTPTFSRATAATDIFKKEDVQSVAAALSTHDHTAGKGALLVAGSIPTGSITSAMLADGTIVSGDIADGTITTTDIADGAVTDFGTVGLFSSTTTTSTSPVLIPGLTTPARTMAGGRAIIVSGRVSAQFATTGQNCNLFLYRDAVQLGCLAIASSAATSQILVLSFSYLDTAATTGSHTWSLYWSTNTGTLSLVGATFAELWIMDVRR